MMYSRSSDEGGRRRRPLRPRGNGLGSSRLATSSVGKRRKSTREFPVKRRMASSGGNVSIGDLAALLQRLEGHVSKLESKSAEKKNVSSNTAVDSVLSESDFESEKSDLGVVEVNPNVTEERNVEESSSKASQEEENAVHMSMNVVDVNHALEINENEMRAEVRRWKAGVERLTDELECSKKYAQSLMDTIHEAEAKEEKLMEERGLWQRERDELSIQVRALEDEIQIMEEKNEERMRNRDMALKEARQQLHEMVQWKHSLEDEGVGTAEECSLLREKVMRLEMLLAEAKKRAGVHLKREFGIIVKQVNSLEEANARSSALLEHMRQDAKRKEHELGKEREVWEVKETEFAEQMESYARHERVVRREMEQLQGENSNLREQIASLEERLSESEQLHKVANNEIREEKKQRAVVSEQASGEMEKLRQNLSLAEDKIRTLQTELESATGDARDRARIYSSSLNEKDKEIIQLKDILEKVRSDCGEKCRLLEARLQQKTEECLRVSASGIRSMISPTTASPLRVSKFDDDRTLDEQRERIIKLANELAMTKSSSDWS